MGVGTMHICSCTCSVPSVLFTEKMTVITEHQGDHGSLQSPYFPLGFYQPSPFRFDITGEIFYYNLVASYFNYVALRFDDFALPPTAYVRVSSVLWSSADFPSAQFDLFSPAKRASSTGIINKWISEDFSFPWGLWENVLVYGSSQHDDWVVHWWLRVLWPA